MGDKPSRFCYTCGNRLVVKPYVWSWDEMTGRPNVAYDYSCPRRSSWNDFLENHPRTDSEAYALQAI